MPLESKATQTTATNSATYLVNRRRRVFGTEISEPARGCASAPVAPRPPKPLRKFPTLIPATLSGPGAIVSRRPVAVSLDHSVGGGKQRRGCFEPECLCPPEIVD